MQLPQPPFRHPPEVYLAIVREHQDSPVRTAQRLQSCGWTLTDATWAAVHWSPLWLATAIANERAGRDARVTSLSGPEPAKLQAGTGEEKEPPTTPKPGMMRHTTTF